MKYYILGYAWLSTSFLANNLILAPLHVSGPAYGDPCTSFKYLHYPWVWPSSRTPRPWKQKTGLPTDFYPAVDSHY